MLKLIKRLVGKSEVFVCEADYSKRLCACPDGNFHSVGFFESLGRISVLCKTCGKQGAGFALIENGIQIGAGMAHALALSNWNRLSRAKTKQAA